MKQKPFIQRIGEFMEGKGFYIVLILCVAAIGISGYFLLSSLVSPATISTDHNNSTQQVNQNEPIEVPVPSAPEEETVTPPAEEPASVQEEDMAFSWPVQGSVSREFSLEAFAYDETMADWRTHSGLDIDTDVGTEVMAVTAGTVPNITQDPLMGTTVVIDHGSGLQSVYSNLAEAPTVAIGDQVNPGVVIGAVGNTAIAESANAPHLHFEMLQDGLLVDPVQFLPSGN